MEKIVIQIGCHFVLQLKGFWWLFIMLKLPDITYSAIILIGTHGQENLLVEESLLKAFGWLIHVFLGILIKETCIFTFYSHILIIWVRILTRITDQTWGLVSWGAQKVFLKRLCEDVGGCQDFRVKEFFSECMFSRGSKGKQNMVLFL